MSSPDHSFFSGLSSPPFLLRSSFSFLPPFLPPSFLPFPSPDFSPFLPLPSPLPPLPSPLPDFSPSPFLRSFFISPPNCFFILAMNSFFSGLSSPPFLLRSSFSFLPPFLPPSFLPFPSPDFSPFLPLPSSSCHLRTC